MTLEATFSLTPRESHYYGGPGLQARLVRIYGTQFYAKHYEGYRWSFDHQHAEDELYFGFERAADPTLDYSDWTNRRLAPHIELHYDLSSLGAKKELALIFGFDAFYSSPRLLIYTDGGLLADETLAEGDNQFLMEVESLDYLSLYFIHARAEGSSYGGNWFFKGITGYVV